MIRLAIPSIEEDDVKAVRDILKSGFLTQGVMVSTFEKSVADYVGSEHAVAVCNCTAALHLALLALDVRAGDIVIVTAYSWIATANVIELCGAEPIFVDIDPRTWNIDPLHLEIMLKRVFANPKTATRVKAILPVHAFGQIAQMDAIMKLANQYNLPVIEDAACALGASLHGKMAGTWGTMGCFSFHPRKIVTTGEGGIIVTDDEKMACRLRALRNHGQDPPEFIMPGFNYRLTEFQAALGLSQMKRINEIIYRRNRLAENYDKIFIDTDVDLPAALKDSLRVYQSYVVLMPENIGVNQIDLIKYFQEQSIQIGIGTVHIPMTKYYKYRYGYKKGDFPVTDSVYSRSLSLPLHERISEAEQYDIGEKILNFLIAN